MNPHYNILSGFTVFEFSFISSSLMNVFFVCSEEIFCLHNGTQGELSQVQSTKTTTVPSRDRHLLLHINTVHSFVYPFQSKPGEM